MMKSKINNNKGVSAVEVAMILPVFLLLIFAVFDFGIYFYDLHTLSHATREGARLGMVGETIEGEDRTGSIIRTIEDKASLAVIREDIDIRIFEVSGPSYLDPGGWETMSPDAGEPDDFMRIKVRYTYDFINPLIAVFFPSGEKEILTEMTYRNEQF